MFRETIDVGHKCTSFSDFCWKCTAKTVPTASSEVPNRVSLDACDMTPSLSKSVDGGRLVDIRLSEGSHWSREVIRGLIDLIQMN